MVERQLVKLGVIGSSPITRAMNGGLSLTLRYINAFLLYFYCRFCFVILT